MDYAALVGVLDGVGDGGDEFDAVLDRHAGGNRQ